jgi:hypothetical protein
MHVVLRTALAKQPTERYQDAEHFIAALAELDDNETVLPEHIAVQEATMLAQHSDCPVPGIPDATLLNPAQGRNRNQIRVPQFRRTWLYAATVLLLVLAGYLLQNHFTGKPHPALNSSGETAATVTEPKAVPPATTELADQREHKNNSALDAVESGRLQKKSTESMAAADRSEPAPMNEWQVVENHSRKIR